MEDILVGGVSMMLLIAGLVEFAKKFGLSGKGLTVLSAMLGLLGAIVVKLSVAIPASFAGWVEMVFFGLAYGLATSGLYDLGRKYASGDKK